MKDYGGNLNEPNGKKSILDFDPMIKIWNINIEKNFSHITERTKKKIYGRILAIQCKQKKKKFLSFRGKILPGCWRWHSKRIEKIKTLPVLFKYCQEIYLLAKGNQTYYMGGYNVRGKELRHNRVPHIISFLYSFNRPINVPFYSIFGLLCRKFYPIYPIDPLLQPIDLL